MYNIAAGGSAEGYAWYEWLQGDGNPKPMSTWTCRRCGTSVTAHEGTEAEVFGKSVDCDEELVRSVMES